MEIRLDHMWAEAQRLFPQIASKIPGALDRAVYAEAQDLRKIMIQQFRDQKPATGPAWKPLSDFTLDARKAQGLGGNKILIRSADLRNSVSIERRGVASVFVGVNRSAIAKGKGGAGMGMVNLGYIHELGAVAKITVTRKMQRFFFGVIMRQRRKRIKAGRDAGGRFVPKGQKAPSYQGGGTFKVGATIVIRIPARPFIGPAIAYKSEAEYVASIATRFAENMQGLLGKP